MVSALISKENNNAKFTMSFAASEFDEALDKAYKEARKDITIDGFRKGKAPRSIIEKKYGATVFYEDALDILFNEAYPRALEELDIEPIDRPELAFGEEPIEKGKDFTVTITVAIPPQIDPKDYIGIEAERQVRYITDQDVEDELMAAQQRAARLVSVERAAQNGDTLTLDYSGFVGDDQFEGGTAEGQTLKLGSGTFIPGFEDQLVGVSAGESKDVVVTFPEEYHEESLAGKEAVFKCTVHEVKEQQLPELNDDFALDVSEFDTLEEYKADLKAKLEKYAADNADMSGKNAVMEKIYEANPVELPEVMIQDELSVMLDELKQQLQYQGATVEMYCQLTGKTEDDLKADMKDDAVRRVSSRLIVKAIADKEGITASDEDVENELVDMAAEYGMDVETFKKFFPESNNKYIKQDLRLRKAVEFCYAQAKITDVELKPELDTAEEAAE